MTTGGSRRLSVQLWSYNYDPEPTGIGPMSGAWATAMRDRGHEVSVCALAQPGEHTSFHLIDGISV